MCGTSRIQAMQWLTWMEQATAPRAPPESESPAADRPPRMA
jgi:hypothetical protein